MNRNSVAYPRLSWFHNYQVYLKIALNKKTENFMRNQHGLALYCIKRAQRPLKNRSQLKCIYVGGNGIRVKKG